MKKNQEIYSGYQHKKLLGR